MRNIGGGNNHTHRLHKAKFPPWHRLSRVRPPGKVLLNYNNYSFSNSNETGKFKGINASQPFTQNLLAQHIVYPDSKVAGWFGYQVVVFFKKVMRVIVNHRVRYLFKGINKFPEIFCLKPC